MKKLTLLLAALLAMPLLAHAFTRVGVGVNFGIPVGYGYPGYGYPLWTPAPTTVVVRQVAAAPPGPGYVWVAPDWILNNGAWTPAPGHWEMPPESNAIWTAGHWERRDNAWAWANGYWGVPTANQPPQPPSPPQSPATAAPAAAAPTAQPDAQAGPPPTDQVVVAEQPPSPMVETVAVAAPGPDYLWVDGYWGWVGGRWSWNHGYWGHRPYADAVWFRSGWHSAGSRGWAFDRGHWGRR